VLLGYVLSENDAFIVQNNNSDYGQMFRRAVKF